MPLKRSLQNHLSHQVYLQQGEPVPEDHFGGKQRVRFSFDLHCDSLQEFAEFIAIIRGVDIDDAKLQEMTARLRKSTNAEQAAVDAASKLK